MVTGHCTIGEMLAIAAWNIRTLIGVAKCSSSLLNIVWILPVGNTSSSLRSRVIAKPGYVLRDAIFLRRFVQTLHEMV